MVCTAKLRHSGHRASRPLLFLCLLLTAFSLSVSAQEDPDTALSELPPAVVEMLEGATTRRMGDLPEIRENKIIRVLTTYNQTNFFVGNGLLRGFEFELLKDYEKHLNQGVSRRELKMSLVFIPVAKDQLIPFLLEGRGDLVAAGLTITPLREAQASFTDPYLSGVDEVVVTSRDVEGLNGPEDLSGRTVYVVNASSYAQHLRMLNEDFLQRGMLPVDVVEADSHLETEDLLELANAGVIDLVVADSHLAELWAEILPHIVVHRDLVINAGGELAWAVRRGNPELLAHLNGYLKKRKKGTELGNVLFRRYFEGTQWVDNPAAVGDEKLARLVELFRKYAERYGLDWMAVAALAYQESKFNQSLRSKAGAVGVMQVLPRTAADLEIHDVENLENNIHAGVRYLDWIRENYFGDEELVERNRVDFILASYNAGPSKIARLRRKAVELGYDPDVWSRNVELVVLRHVGQEPVRYVSNIHKYYLAFKLAERRIQNRREERHALQGRD